MSNFLDEYMDVLQNIEYAIINTYRQYTELVDFEVEAAINALVSQYKAEQRGRAPHSSQLTPLGQQVFSAVQGICEWRLGRQEIAVVDDGSGGPRPEPLSVDEMIACLQRIRKSIRLWTKQGGRQGYLDFIDEFIH